ncbi:extracellular catalytic domain type 1 short-chain-length polyhydroxyalkanoate depolymerase [Phyllobacterium lublinensis]|jgi:poly(hydroxyalkanoate) depolymerase family esterase|uniref:extracellular catalytic domain type 1 short-chain-length polyhydroxyalkanoate depolymerase n=1 Tax=Phyllobacterium lublinensis TaxID=2875708 RepID=UPI001CCD7CA8|nr:PHB depolymerase family esterase [Phyllobacterium sp. 2063]MBZ9657311.1 PHB depolymerase family esterase [Phyllobacterium sp. 2063]
MRSIASTIKRLNVLRTVKSSPITVSKNTRLQPMSDFGDNPGNLTAWTYVPTTFEPGGAVVVVLHGCTQNAASYDHGAGWSQLADKHGFALLFPEQQRVNNPNLCFNWFATADITRGQGEVHSISQMVRTMIERHSLDSGRVFVTGLSAGGAMTTALLATYPELFKAGAVIAGLPFGTASNIPEAFERMQGQGLKESRILTDKVRHASDHQGPWPSLSVWHGTADKTVDPINMEATVGQWWHLHELDENPIITSQLQNHRCRTWSDSAGTPRIEAHTITGMGHGTPIKSGENGVSMPFMLDVGISSTFHIASSWGLIGEQTISSVAVSPYLPVPASDDSRHHSPHPVGTVIEDALRKAGLM